MKILWICPSFLHPTNRGGQIRTLSMLKELNRRHEIHFAALNDPANTEGPRRCPEYSSRHIEVAHTAAKRGSLALLGQVLGSFVRPVPLGISRYASAKLRRAITALLPDQNYDCVVCDFLAAAPSVPQLSDCVLFEHNVETTILQRHAQQCTSLPQKFFYKTQAAKMQTYERHVCRSVKKVIAVSGIDAERIRVMCGLESVASVSTGVDIDYFSPPQLVAPASDIVFCGSMDWLPNVDGVLFFLSEILPLIRARIPQTTFTIAGRSPDARVVKAVEGLDGVSVTGTVDDMRPYLWGSRISVVPLRIGGGTRLKIFESMAAGTPVVSTAIGAEGLPCAHGTHLLLADTCQDFASACIRLLSDSESRNHLAHTARQYAVSDLSWDAVSRDFEKILRKNRLAGEVRRIESAS